MQLVNIGETIDPRFNLAAEEHVIRNFPVGSDYLLLYINKPSIIVGKNQNVFEEVNLRFTEANKIDIIRRISGGGTVYHDEGNLNYSLISKSGKYTLDTLSELISQVVSYLNLLGVPAEKNDRNDIYLDGKKISGNARFSSKDILCTHSTLLFNANLDKLQKSLDLGEIESDSKSTKSVRSKVVTIKDYLNKDLTITEFKKKLTKYLVKDNSNSIDFNEQDFENIENLIKTKYNNWDWNIGRSPKSTIERDIFYNDKKMKVSISIEDGIIEQIKSENAELNYYIDKFSHLLIGKKYIISKLEDVLRSKINDQKFQNIFYSII